MRHPSSPSGPMSAFEPARCLALATAVLVLIAGFMVVLPTEARAVTPYVPASEFVNISATSSFSFVPDSFTVEPGSLVHLVVTQLADFNHTFTLSPAVNVTIPSADDPAQVAAFFNAHTPIANLSLGSTAGKQTSVTFTAPTALGAYEFVCLIHFPTMTGIMTVANTPPSSGSSSSPTPVELVAIGAGVGVVVVAIALFAWSRARRRSRSGGGSPPPRQG
jgi:plastocyanin